MASMILDRSMSHALGVSNHSIEAKRRSFVNEPSAYVTHPFLSSPQTLPLNSASKQ